MKKRIFALLFVTIIGAVNAQNKSLQLLLKENSQPYENVSYNFQNTSSPKEKKLVFLAMLASLAIPGLGEWYAGYFETGKYHFVAECGLWFTYAAFRIHSNWVLNDARTFARQHAGADFSNKDDRYVVNIGNFYDTDEYNETKAKKREYNLIYDYNTNPDYWWRWDVDENRVRFREMRIRGDRIKNNSKFVLGVIAVNHLVSAISAVRKTVAYNKSIAGIDGIQIYTYARNSFRGINQFELGIVMKF